MNGKLPTERQVVRRAKAIGWTQNSLARRAGKDGGFVSKLLRKEIRSPGAFRELVETLETGEASEGARPTDPGPK